MKAKKILYSILMFLPLLVTVIALPFLPDQIPAHYNFEHQVDRWGSKYETLLFPFITILFGALMLWLAKRAAKQESAGQNNEKVCITTGLFSLALFNCMTFYFLYTDFHRIEDLSEVSLDVTQMFFGLLGIGMILIGHSMPKTKRNSIIGLRTTWSMKNDITWEKSQRFGGVTFILNGILILIISLLTTGTACALWSLGSILLFLPADILYTYKISRKY